MIKKLKHKISSLDIHTVEVVRKSGAATLVKVGGMLVGVLVSIFLGRALGPEGLGVINLSNRIVTILVIFALLGTPQLLIKEIAIAFNRKDWKRIGDYMFSAYRLNGATALLLSAVLIIAAPFISRHIFNEPELVIPLIIALSAMTFQVFSRIFSSGLIGYRKIWQSNLVNKSLSVAVTGIALMIMWFFNIKITIVNVAVLYAFGRLVVVCSVGLYWNKLYSHKIERTNLTSKLFKSALPFLLVSGTVIIASNIDAIMIGWLSNSRNVGLYSVAARGALLAIFFLQVTNSALSPKLAALYAEGKIPEMNKLVQRVTAVLLGVGILPTVFFFFLGDHVLSLWGEEFTEAYWVLVVLSIGQLFNIGTGAAGLVLIMCGHEKLHAYVSIGAVVLNVILNYFLVRQYGALGAAIATATAIAVENIGKVIFAKIKTGIMTLPINL